MLGKKLATPSRVKIWEKPPQLPFRGTTTKWPKFILVHLKRVFKPDEPHGPLPIIQADGRPRRNGKLLRLARMMFAELCNSFSGLFASAIPCSSGVNKRILSRTAPTAIQTFNPRSNDSATDY